MKPKVSIVCLVYNHSKYLRDCLDGFIMQKTNFPFEAIVHDDCSIDRSQEIIKEYADKYPNIIKPIFEKENQYSKKDGSLRKIIDAHITGEYVAICEGDDYWTDPNKLQQQVDFLDSHSDYSLCFHNVNVKNETKNKYVLPLYETLENREYTADEIIEKWTVPTCSALLKKQSYISRPSNPKFCVGDNIIWLTCCTQGRVFCIDKKMATYRRTNGGWTGNTYSKNKKATLDGFYKYLTHLALLKYYFPNIGEKGILKKEAEYYARICIAQLYLLKPEVFNTLAVGIRKYGLNFINKLLIEINRKIGWRIRVRVNNLLRH